MLCEMTDTVDYEYMKAINLNVIKSMINNLVHQYAWFIDIDSFGNKTVTQVNNNMFVLLCVASGLFRADTQVRLSRLVVNMMYALRNVARVSHRV